MCPPAPRIERAVLLVGVVESVVPRGVLAGREVERSDVIANPPHVLDRTSSNGPPSESAGQIDQPLLNPPREAHYSTVRANALAAGTTKRMFVGGLRVPGAASIEETPVCERLRVTTVPRGGQIEITSGQARVRRGGPQRVRYRHGRDRVRRQVEGQHPPHGIRRGPGAILCGQSQATGIHRREPGRDLLQALVRRAVVQHGRRPASAGCGNPGACPVRPVWCEWRRFGVPVRHGFEPRCPRAPRRVRNRRRTAARSASAALSEPADVIGPAAQGIAAGEFDELVEAIRAGIAYANIHTNVNPAGGISAASFARATSQVASCGPGRPGRQRRSLSYGAARAPRHSCRLGGHGHRSGSSWSCSPCGRPPAGLASAPPSRDRPSSPRSRAGRAGP